MRGQMSRNLQFPMYYEVFEGEAIWLLNENTVETIALLSKVHTVANV